MLGRIRRSAASLLVVGLLGAGCASDPEPRFAEQTSEPPSFTSSPDDPVTATPTGPQEPELPAAAQGKGKAAGVAFMKYYWGLVTYTHESGDSEPARDAGTDGCQACSSALDAIEKVIKRGGQYEGVNFTITIRGEPRLGTTSRDIVVEADVTLRSTRGTLSYDDGSSKVIDAVNRDALMRVIRSKDDGRWQVLYWGLEQE